jgi:hypothetical protein
MRVKSYQQFFENRDSEFYPNDEAIEFKDVNGVVAKVNDLVALEDGQIGKVLRFFMQDNKHTTNEPRMEVDLRSSYLELNPMSTFEIIAEPSEDLKKAFGL